MNTYFLKANTQAELQSALDGAGLNTGNAETPYYGVAGNFSVDWIGEIFEPTGAVLDAGTESEHKEMVSIGGYHCNLYGTSELPSSLAQYLVDPAPNSPVRILAI